MKCRHDATIPVKVSNTRTNLKCCACDEIVGMWEDAPKHLQKKEKKPSRKRFTSKEKEKLR